MIRDCFTCEHRMHGHEQVGCLGCTGYEADEPDPELRTSPKKQNNPYDWYSIPLDLTNDRMVLDFLAGKKTYNKFPGINKYCTHEDGNKAVH